MNVFVTRIIGTSFDEPMEFQNKLQKLDFKYYTFGIELCPTTQRKHCQFFAILNKKKRLSSLRKKLSCHTESARGTNDQCIKYCQKDGDFIQFGELPVEKQESGPQRWQELLDLAKNRQMNLIAKNDPKMFVLHFHRWKAIQDHFPQQFPSVESRVCIWLWSKQSGVGKSRWCETRFPNAYRKSLTSKFFQGYVDQETILIEDIDTSCASFGHDLKLWGDIYPLLVEVKCSHVYLTHRRLIVTSNYKIAELWTCPRLVNALNRRFLTFEVLDWDDDVNDAYVSHNFKTGYLNNFLMNYEFF